MNTESSFMVPTLISASPFNPTALTGIERLPIALPNIVSGEGKKTVVTGRRYMYLYPDVPDFLFLSDSRLYNEERGIPVFWLKYFHETGLVFLKPTTESIMDSVSMLLDGLQSADIFNALSSSYSLKALLGMKYISPRCVQESLNLAQYSHTQMLQAAEIAREMEVPTEVIAQLQLTESYNAVMNKHLKEITSVSTAIGTGAMTQETRDTVPTSITDTGHQPSQLADSKAEQAIRILNPDSKDVDKLSIETDEGVTVNVTATTLIDSESVPDTAVIASNGHVEDTVPSETAMAKAIKTASTKKTKDTQG